jgi:thiamine-phosphate pyrophosphorylase
MKLYLLSPPRESFLERVPDLFQNGVDWFQYRRPELADREQAEELQSLVEQARRHDVTLIVNNRPDLAVATGADGVHLGSDDLPVSAVKEEWPSLTVGSTQRVDEPFVEEADYYGLGPVFEPRSKSVSHEPSGWEKALEKVRSTSKPVFAIGGMTEKRVSEVPRELEGVAVLSAVWEADDPAEAVSRLSDRLGVS